MRERLSRRRRWTLLLVACGALLASAGVAYATIPDSSGQFHACVTSNGQVTIIDHDAFQNCKLGSQHVHWSWIRSAGPTPGPPAGSAQGPSRYRQARQGQQGRPADRARRARRASRAPPGRRDTGPAGPAGPAGPQGDTGAQGPAGPQGPRSGARRARQGRKGRRDRRARRGRRGQLARRTSWFVRA